MNPLREYIMNELVKPEIAAQNKTYIARVDSYNADMGVATVITGDVGSETKYDNVPFTSSTKGVYGNDIDSGSLVVVSFMQGDAAYPYIVSVLAGSPTDTTTGSSTGKDAMQSEAMQAPSVKVNGMTKRQIRSTQAADAKNRLIAVHEQRLAELDR
jgi:hypothetical protein